MSLSCGCSRCSFLKKCIVFRIEKKCNGKYKGLAIQYIFHDCFENIREICIQSIFHYCFERPTIPPRLPHPPNLLSCLRGLMDRIEFGSQLEKENAQERPGGPDPGARGVEALEEEGGKYRETRVEKKHKI